MTEQPEKPAPEREEAPVIVTSCQKNCGVRIGNKVNWCSPGCREWAEWGREA